MTFASDTPLLLKELKLVLTPTEAPKPAKLPPTDRDILTETLSLAVLERSVPMEVLYASWEVPPE